MSILINHLTISSLFTLLILFSSCSGNNYNEDSGGLFSHLEKELNAKFSKVAKGKDSDSEGGSDDPDPWENGPREELKPTKEDKAGSLAVKPLRINLEVKLKLDSFFKSKFDQINDRNEDKISLEPLGESLSDNNSTILHLSEVSEPNGRQNTDIVNKVEDRVRYSDSSGSEVSYQIYKPDLEEKPIDLNNSLCFTPKEVEDVYYTKNQLRLAEFKLKKTHASISYKDKGRDCSKVFYNTLYFGNNAWEFYASDIVVNPNSSLTNAVKEIRTEELKKNWLNLMNCKFKTYYLGNDITRGVERLTAFKSPSGTVENIDSFINIKNGLLSNKCLFYIKPPSNFRLGGLNKYKVTKLFYYKSDEKTVFVELKLKTETSIVFLYLKSSEFESIPDLVPTYSIYLATYKSRIKKAFEIINSDI